jgi:hypothetical protein
VIVTLTVTVHDPLAGIVAPARVNPVPLGAAVTLPPHVVAPAGAAVLTRPAGYVSMSPAFVSAVVLGLVSVTVSTLAPPTVTAVGLNAFAIVGAASTSTSSLVEDAEL